MPAGLCSGDHDPASSSPTLPPQVSPPEFAAQRPAPHALRGRGRDRAARCSPGDGRQRRLLGPGAAELGDALGLDLLALLERRPGHRARPAR